MSGTSGTSVARRRLRDLGVGARFTLIFALVLVLLLLLGAMFRFLAGEYRDARIVSLDGLQQLLLLEEVETVVLQMDSSLRGFLLTGSEDFLHGYREGNHRLPAIIDGARVGARDRPAGLERLEAVTELHERWRNEFAEPALQMRRAGDSDALSALTQSGRGLAILGQLRDELDKAAAAQRAHLAQVDARLNEHARQVETASITAIIVGLLVLLLAVRLLSRSVVEPLNALSAATKRMAAGETDVEIRHTRQQDEVGDIARGLAAFYEVSRQVQHSAWMSGHVVDVTDAVVRQDDWDGFAHALLQRICPLLDCSAAVLYHADEDSGDAQCIGTWAADAARLDTPARFAPGEGLVGECLRSARPIVRRDLPPDYPVTRSGTGSIRPRYLHLQPLRTGDRAIGVLELACLSELDEARVTLLEELCKTVALSMAGLGGKLRTQALLQRSEAQAQALRESEEELRAQQEELRATNDALSAQAAELEEQGERLRASDEELRAHAQELRDANAELQERSVSLQRASDAIRVKNEEIERASRYKSEFLANMSHELRTPLNALLILAKSLADNDERNLSEDQIESAQIIHESGQNLLRLINDVLDLSKIEAGKVEVAREPFELSPLLTALSRQFRPLAERKSLDFEVHSDASLPECLYGDQDKLRQILINLVGNAIKFTEAGSVTLDVTRDAVASVDDETTLALHFQVRDTGIGIDADTQDRVFRAFEQADGSTSRRYGGTGLGLAISRRLTELMGGTLELESEAGKGSCFHLRLPVARDTATESQAGQIAPTDTARRRDPDADGAAATGASPASPAATPAAEANRKILIVEDDPHFAKILAGMARERGSEVLLADTGRSALALARDHLPGGIILDVGLPDMDGFSVFDALRKDAATKHIPVHFVTAADESQRALGAGAASFLTKPVSRDTLEKTFADMLPPLADGATRKLLLVDDDAATRAAVVSLLRSRPEVKIHQAATGTAAIKAATKERFDCVILDLNLPDMSGFEVLDALEREGEMPPVVVYSGRELEADEAMRLRAHTDSIVIKGERSPQRLLDEVELFLHAIRKPGDAGQISRQGVSDLNGRHVLLVDDDVRNIFALSKALRSRGIDVRMANDGAKALALLDSEAGSDIELVLMDIMMPGMDGYEAMRRLRSDPRHRNLPIIALTAKAMRGDREKCIEAGASDYLSKPVDVDKLCSMIRIWLDERQGGAPLGGSE